MPHRLLRTMLIKKKGKCDTDKFINRCKNTDNNDKHTKSAHLLSSSGRFCVLKPNHLCIKKGSFKH
jgi:hypothetical protein